VDALKVERKRGASGRIPRKEELEASSEAARSSGWSDERSEGEVKVTRAHNVEFALRGLPRMNRRER
jgi:hypothetical protein